MNLSDSIYRKSYYHANRLLSKEHVSLTQVGKDSDYLPIESALFVRSSKYLSFKSEKSDDLKIELEKIKEIINKIISVYERRGFKEDFSCGETDFLTMISYHAAVGDSFMIELVKRFIDMGAIQRIGNNQPIFNAVSSYNYELLYLFLENGMNTNESSFSIPLLTLLIDKVSRRIFNGYFNDDDTNALRVLIDYGINIEAIGVKGETPIFHCTDKAENALLLLIDRGARINVKDNDEVSLFSYFVKNDRLNLAEVLLEQESLIIGEDDIECIHRYIDVIKEDESAYFQEYSNHALGIEKAETLLKLILLSR